MTDRKEFFRQSVHIVYWPLLIILHYNNIISTGILFILITSTLIISILVKNNIKIPIFYSFLKNTEREADFKKFPWEGFFYFTLSCIFLFILYKDKIWIAYTSILILCTLDAVSTLIWKKYWKHKWFFNKNKSIEGSVAWFVAAIWWTYFLSSSYDIGLSFLVIACFFSMIVEIPEMHIFGLKVNDNISIPITAAVVLNVLPSITNNLLT